MTRLLNSLSRIQLGKTFRMFNRTGSVYGLTDPRYGHVIRYVGKTVQSPNKRYSNHIAQSKVRDAAVNRWIRKLQDMGLLPGMQILHEDISEPKLTILEIMEISKHREQPEYELLNLTAGGEGTVGYQHTEATKTKLSEINMGKVLAEETKHKISEALSGSKHYGYGKPLTPEHKAKISKAKYGTNNPMWGKHHSEYTLSKMRGQKRSETTRTRIAAARTGTKHSAETRKKMSDAHKRRHSERNNF